MKVALITDITGQDGSYLAELPLGRYEVHVLFINVLINTHRMIIFTIITVKLHYGDLTDSANMSGLFKNLNLMKFIT